MLSASIHLFEILSILPWLGLIASCSVLFAPDRSKQRLTSGLILVAQVLPFVVLLIALATRSTEVLAVWRAVGEDLPLVYRISSAWSSREGPLLMWAAMLASLSWWCRRRYGSNVKMFPILDLITCSLFLISIGMGPFTLSTQALLLQKPAEMNPLLQTPLMAIHPPIIFAFYSMTLLTAQCDFFRAGGANPMVDADAHRSALLTFIIGTLGIGLGGLWAFTVLDWGGYWAWDPVETGSLLPWLVIAMRLHAPHSSLFRSIIVQRSCAAILTGSTIFATLVTRAGGVWASVHAFVGSTQGSTPRDGLLRLLSVSYDPIAGTEIIAYLSILILVLTYLVAATLEAPTLPRALCISILVPTMSSLIFGPTMAIILLAIITVVLLQWILLRTDMVLKLELESIIVLLLLMSTSVTVFGPWSGPSTEVWSWWMDGLLLVCLTPFFVVHAHGIGARREITRWGIVLLLLLGAWVGLTGVPTAAVMIIAILAPWVLEDGEGQRTGQQKGLNLSRIVRDFAPVLGIIYFTMTLFVLFASMDVPQFGLHEVLGAPFLVLVLLGLPIAHGVGKVDLRRLSVLMLFSFASTLTGVLLFIDSLPGDAHIALAGAGITRGVIAMLIIPPLLLSIPGLILPLWSAFRQVRTKASVARIRRFGTVVVHFGFVLLLLGHVFSTTLVARGDLGHVVSVTQDVPVMVGKHAYTLDSFEIISADDDAYDATVGIGDGYIGLNLKVVDSTTFEQTTMTPGVIRFDDSMMARSEVSRMTTSTGVTVAILDSQQASDLMSKLSVGESVDRVRVTIYDLPLNQLVWLGWILMVGGSATVLSTTPRVRAEEEE